MRIIRFLGSITLWLGALVGIAAGSVWIGGRLNLIQPMIVISGSMEPGIMTGDLLIDRPTPTAHIQPGDVLSLPSEATGKLVTHRVLSITPLDAERAGQLGFDLDDGPRWEVRMQGDANDEPDIEAYYPGDSVLTPAVQIPGLGAIVSKVMEPAVAMPVLIALVALLGVSLLDEEPRRVVRRVIDRVRHRDARLEELDVELAAVGIDVVRLQKMDHLDLQLYALGIDIGVDIDGGTSITGDPAVANAAALADTEAGKRAAVLPTGERRLVAQLSDSARRLEAELDRYAHIPDHVLAAIGIRPLRACTADVAPAPAPAVRDAHELVAAVDRS